MREFFEYIKKHPFLWAMVVVFSFLAHGPMMLSNSVGIDTEVLVNDEEQNFLLIGRQGLVLLKYLLGNGEYNPLYAGILSTLFLALAGMLWSFLFSGAMGQKRDVVNVTPAIVFSLLFLASGILTLQLYFKLQALEFTFGFCLLAVNLCFLFSCLEQSANGKRYLWVLAVFPNLILFSVYQIFEVLFVFGVAAYFLLKCHFDNEYENKPPKELWQLMGKTIGVFLVSVIVNQIISSIFFMEGASYLAGQIFWTKQPIRESIRQIVGHIVLCLLGLRDYYSVAYFLFDLLLLFIGIRFVRKCGNAHLKWLASVSLLLVYAAPFLMTLLMANIPVTRSQLVLPFAIAFSGFFLLHYFSGKMIPYALVLIISFLCVISQFSYTQRLNYTDATRYAEDVRLAGALQQSIRLLETETRTVDYCPLVIVGRKEANLNAVCVQGEDLSHSFFAWDNDVEPRYFHSSRRIVGFLDTLGSNFTFATPEELEEAKSFAENMPIYPAKGSVALHKGVIVIRLSEE